MVEIFFNPGINDYTLREVVDGVKSYKRVPIKFKLEDSTSKYRKDILKKEILDRYDV